MIELLFLGILTIFFGIAGFIIEKIEKEEKGNRFVKYDIKEERWY